MTCIVGLVDDDGNVWVGADSCGSNGHTYAAIHEGKVFERDGMLFGCTGTFRLIDLLRYSLAVQMPREGDDLESFVRGDLLRAVKKTFKDNGYLREREGIASFDGPFLLGWRGRLWEMQCDLSVIATPPWGHAIGSGEEPARGALHAARELKPRDRMLAALEASAAVVATVREPFAVWRLDGDGKAKRMV